MQLRSFRMNRALLVLDGAGRDRAVAIAEARMQANWLVVVAVLSDKNKPGAVRWNFFGSVLNEAKAPLRRALDAAAY